MGGLFVFPFAASSFVVAYCRSFFCGTLYALNIYPLTVRILCNILSMFYVCFFPKYLSSYSVLKCTTNSQQPESEDVVKASIQSIGTFLCMLQLNGPKSSVIKQKLVIRIILSCVKPYRLNFSILHEQNTSSHSSRVQRMQSDLL